MNCRSCGFPHAGQYALCPVCGELTEKTIPALPAPKRSRARLPYLLLLGMLFIGTVLFFLIPLDTDRTPAIPEETAAVPETAADTTAPSQAKALFQKDCFILENGTLYFDESKFIASPILIVPSAMDDQPVERIGSSCFEGLEGVTTVILPSSVTEIGDRAFAGCADLRGVTIPNAAESIGTDAFRGCKSLEAVYIPTGLSGIGSGAFEECPKLCFVFYNGFYSQWQSLYPEFITPFTWIIAWDGEYRHGAKTP